MVEGTGRPGIQAFSEEERQRLANAAIAFEGSATTEQIDRVVRWAAQARSDAATLQLVLEGRAGVRVADDGKVALRLVK